MRSLSRPSIDSVDVYQACISGIADVDVRKQFAVHTSKIYDAEAKFERAVISQELHKLLPGEFSMHPLTAAEVSENVYNSGLVRRSAGRTFYDKIMSASDNDLCPRCGIGEVRSLDHHLPKSAFPALAVAVSNLLPVCTDCNKIKSDKTPRSAFDQIMHPYFDSVDSERWLAAVLTIGRPAVVEFRVQPPTSWTPQLCDRVRHHFEIFNLAYRYSLQANRLIASFRNAVVGWNAKSGPGLVADNLTHLADSYLSNDANNHEGVALLTLAGSAWFCGGGSYA